MTCAHFGLFQICTQVDTSAWTCDHPTQVNASWVTSICCYSNLLANQIKDMPALKWLFCDLHVCASPFGHQMQVSTQVQLLGTPCESILPGLLPSVVLNGRKYLSGTWKLPHWVELSNLIFRLWNLEILVLLGSVAYVSRSGGMSNELNNIISRTTDGVYEGVAIGGDRYPGTTFMDHVIRYQENPDVKMIVVLGEVQSLFALTWRVASIKIHLTQLWCLFLIPGWWYWGIQDLRGHKEWRGYQACRSLVYWDMCRNVHVRGEETEFHSFVHSYPAVLCYFRTRINLTKFSEPLYQGILSQIVGECWVLSFLCVLQVQFGHAGASAHGENETAVAKNNVRFSFYEFTN